MMRSLGCIAGISLALMAGAQSARAQTMIPPSPADFAMAAAQSDQYEIVAAQLASVQGQDPRVQAFAETMLRDHARLAADLRQAVVSAGLPAPVAAMSSDQAALLSGLQGLRGAAFDRAYARQQVLAHAQAVAVEGSFADGGANPDLQKAARTALPIIEEHLKMAQQLRDQLGGG